MGRYFQLSGNTKKGKGLPTRPLESCSTLASSSVQERREVPLTLNYPVGVLTHRHLLALERPIL